MRFRFFDQNTSSIILDSEDGPCSSSATTVIFFPLVHKRTIHSSGPDQAQPRSVGHRLLLQVVSVKRASTCQKLGQNVLFGFYGLLRENSFPLLPGAYFLPDKGQHLFHRFLREQKVVRKAKVFLQLLVRNVWLRNFFCSPASLWGEEKFVHGTGKIRRLDRLFFVEQRQQASTPFHTTPRNRPERHTNVRRTSW